MVQKMRELQREEERQNEVHRYIFRKKGSSRKRSMLRLWKLIRMLS